MAFKMKKFSGFGEGSGKKAPMNFNAGLRAASKAGKLDNNPKFKKAVDNAPMKKNKKSLSQRYADKILSPGKTRVGKAIRKAHDFIVDSSILASTGYIPSMAELRKRHQEKKRNKKLDVRGIQGQGESMKK
tara:strand:+ start:38 stop:430 length:393 start_codon:yes stop_codon:yes gene_type:complete